VGQSEHLQSHIGTCSAQRAAGSRCAAALSGLAASLGPHQQVVGWVVATQLPLRPHADGLLCAVLHDAAGTSSSGALVNRRVLVGCTQYSWRE